MWLNYGADGILELLSNQTGETTNRTLEIQNDYKISYKGKTGTFYFIGNLPMDLGNLRIGLQLVESETGKKHRFKIDLFDTFNVQNQCKELSEKQGFDANLLEADLLQLTDLLEEYRESLFEAEINPITDQFSAKELTPQAQKTGYFFLCWLRVTKCTIRFMD
jgi:hypothetical protein